MSASHSVPKKSAAKKKQQKKKAAQAKKDNIASESKALSTQKASVPLLTDSQITDYGQQIYKAGLKQPDDSLKATLKEIAAKISKRKIRVVIDEYIMKAGNTLKYNIMHNLAARGQLSKIKILVDEYNVDPLYYNEAKGISASIMSPAAVTGQLAIIQYLCERKPKPSDEIISAALFEAVDVSAFKIVDYFFTHVAINTAILNGNRQTILEVAYRTDPRSGRQAKPNSEIGNYIEKLLQQKAKLAIEQESRPKVNQLETKSAVNVPEKSYYEDYKEIYQQHLSDQKTHLDALHQRVNTSDETTVTIEKLLHAAAKLNHLWVIKNFIDKYHIETLTSTIPAFSRQPMLEVLQEKISDDPEGQVAQYLKKRAKLKFHKGTAAAVETIISLPLHDNEEIDLMANPLKTSADFFLTLAELQNNKTISHEDYKQLTAEEDSTYTIDPNHSSSKKAKQPQHSAKTQATSQRKKADKLIAKKADSKEAIKCYQEAAEYDDKRAIRRLALCTYTKIMPSEQQGLANFKQAIAMQDSIAITIYHTVAPKDSKSISDDIQQELNILWQTLNYLRQACSLGDTLALVYLAALSGNQEIVANITQQQINTVRQDWEHDVKIFNLGEPLKSALTVLNESIEHKKSSSTTTIHSQDTRPQSIISAINKLISLTDENEVKDSHWQQKITLLNELNELLSTITPKDKIMLFQSDNWLKAFNEALNSPTRAKFLIQIEQCETKLHPHDKELESLTAIASTHLLDNTLPQYTALLSKPANHWMAAFIKQELTKDDCKPVILISAALVYKQFISPSFEHDDANNALGDYFNLDMQVFNRCVKKLAKSTDITRLGGFDRESDATKDSLLNMLNKLNTNNPRKLPLLTCIPSEIKRLVNTEEAPQREAIIAKIVALIHQATPEQKAQLHQLPQWQNEVKLHLSAITNQSYCIDLLKELQKQSQFDFPYAVYPNYYDSLKKLDTSINSWASNWIDKSTKENKTNNALYNAVTLYPDYQYIAKQKARPLTHNEIDQLFVHSKQTINIQNDEDKNQLFEHLSPLYNSDPVIADAIKSDLHEAQLSEHLSPLHKSDPFTEEKKSTAVLVTPTRTEPTQSTAFMTRTLSESIKEIKAESYRFEIKFTIAKDEYFKWNKFTTLWFKLIKHGITLPVGGIVLDIALASLHSKPLTMAADIDMIHFGKNKIILDETTYGFKPSARVIGNRSLLRSSDTDLDVINDTPKDLTAALMQDSDMRDLPANAMYLDHKNLPKETTLPDGTTEVTATILDFKNGYSDTKNHQLKSHTLLYGIDACVIHRLILTAAKVQATGKTISTTDLKEAAAHVGNIWNEVPWRVMEYFSRLFVSKNAVRHFQLCCETGLFPTLLFPAKLTHDLQDTLQEVSASAAYITHQLNQFITQLDAEKIAKNEFTWQDLKKSNRNAVYYRSIVYGFFLGNLYYHFIKKHPAYAITNWNDFFKRKINILIKSFTQLPVNLKRPILYCDEAVSTAMKVINGRLTADNTHALMNIRIIPNMPLSANENKESKKSSPPQKLAAINAKRYDLMISSLNNHNLTSTDTVLIEIAKIFNLSIKESWQTCLDAIIISFEDKYTTITHRTGSMDELKSQVDKLIQFLIKLTQLHSANIVLIANTLYAVSRINKIAPQLFKSVLTDDIIKALIQLHKTVTTAPALHSYEIALTFNALAQTLKGQEEHFMRYRELKSIILILLDRLFDHLPDANNPSIDLILPNLANLVMARYIMPNQIGKRIIPILKLLNTLTANVNKLNISRVSDTIVSLAALSFEHVSLFILKDIPAIIRLLQHIDLNANNHMLENDISRLFDGLRDLDIAASCPDLSIVSNCCIELLLKFASLANLEAKHISIILSAFAFFENNVHGFASIRNDLLLSLIRSMLKLPDDKINAREFSEMISTIAIFDIPFAAIAPHLHNLLSKANEIASKLLIQPSLPTAKIKDLRSICLFYGYCLMNGEKSMVDKYHALREHIQINPPKVDERFSLISQMENYYHLFSDLCIMNGLNVALKPHYHEAGYHLAIGVFNHTGKKVMAIVFNNNNISDFNNELPWSHHLREKRLAFFGWLNVWQFTVPKNQSFVTLQMRKDIGLMIQKLRLVLSQPVNAVMAKPESVTEQKSLGLPFFAAGTASVVMNEVTQRGSIRKRF